MELEFVVDLWGTMKEYIPAKARQTAADHLVINIIDAGASEALLNELQSTDEYMEEALKEHFEEDEDPSDEWDEDY